MKDTMIDSRYLLLDPIGSGGEARVFRARDTASDHEVALRLGRQPGASTHFGLMPPWHEGWVKLLGEGLDPQYGAYHVFELLEGKTLDQLVRQSPLDPENWFFFVNQSLDAVEALHNAGWIHGDLNADNFFRTPARWKLLELPFLRFDPEADRTALFGSIHTLPPEQLNGDPPDVRSDLYSLGCLYYYAASGEYPHAGTSSQEIAVSRLRFDPAPLRQKAPRLSADASTWVMTLLAREPQNRFPSVSAARQMLAIA
jgi:serine/threonine protein kinase